MTTAHISLSLSLSSVISLVPCAMSATHRGESMHERKRGSEVCAALLARQRVARSFLKTLTMIRVEREFRSFWFVLILNVLFCSLLGILVISKIKRPLRAVGLTLL